MDRTWLTEADVIKMSETIHILREEISHLFEEFEVII